MQINASDNTPGSSPLIGLGSHNAGLFNLREVNPKLLPELLKKIHERISYGSSPIADPVASEFAISLVTLGDAAAITPGASWLDLIHTPHADDLTDDPIRVIGAIGANASKIIRTFLDSRSDKQSTLSALKGRLRTGFTKLVNEQPLKDRKAALEALVSEPSGSETLTRFLITLVKGCKALSAGVDSDSHLRMWGLVKELKKYSAGRYDKRSILFQDDGANILESAKLTNESKEKISNSLDDIYIGALFKELLEDYAANLEQTTSQAAQVSKTKASWGPTLAWVGSLASLGTILTVFLNSGGNAEPANQPAVNVMSAKDVVAAMHKVVTEVTVSPSALAKQINEAGSLEELAGKGLNLGFKVTAKANALLGFASIFSCTDWADGLGKYLPINSSAESFLRSNSLIDFLLHS